MAGWKMDLLKMYISNLKMVDFPANHLSLLEGIFLKSLAFMRWPPGYVASPNRWPVAKVLARRKTNKPRPGEFFTPTRYTKTKMAMEVI